MVGSCTDDRIMYEHKLCPHHFIELYVNVQQGIIAICIHQCSSCFNYTSRSLPVNKEVDHCHLVGSGSIVQRLMLLVV